MAFFLISTIQIITCRDFAASREIELLRKKWLKIVRRVVQLAL